jgi:conjugal transfer pilus assembly protein TraD
MIGGSPRARRHLALVALLSLFTGAAFFARRDRLPYGGAAAVPVAAAGALGAILAGALWLRAGRLQRRLVEPESFEIPVDAIPAREGSTYLGKGFNWTPLHAERLAELALSDTRLPEASRDLCGGNWLIHGIGADSCRDLFIPDRLLTQHLFALGAPGSGKTRLLELLVEQAVRRGDAVVVIDPKGDERLLDRTYDAAVRAGREGDFRFFALPYPSQSARYNPLAHYVRANEITDRVALVLPRGGGDAEAFRNFAWDFVNTVTTALDILGEGISVASLQNYCLHNTWLLVRKLMKRVCRDHSIDTSGDVHRMMDQYRTHCARRGRGYLELDQLVKMARMDPAYFDKVSSALKPVFSKLMSPSVGCLLCPNEVESAAEVPPSRSREISWPSIDRDRLIVYFFLGSMIGAETASGVARMTLADLQSYLGKKYAYTPASSFGRITVIVDESGDVLAPETVNLLNKARGAELSICLAAQSLADLDVALRSPADARRALANMATFLTLRTQNPEDAQYFSDKCGRRPMRVVTESEMYEPALFSSGNRAIDDFAFRSTRSTTPRQEPLVPAYVLGELPRFHFLAHYSGEVYQGVIPFLDAPQHRFSPGLKGVTP